MYKYDGPSFFRAYPQKHEKLKFHREKRQNIFHQHRKLENQRRQEQEDVTHTFSSFSPTPKQDNVNLETNPLMDIVNNFHPKPFYSSADSALTISRTEQNSATHKSSFTSPFQITRSSATSDSKQSVIHSANLTSKSTSAMTIYRVSESSSSANDTQHGNPQVVSSTTHASVSTAPSESSNSQIDSSNASVSASGQSNQVVSNSQQSAQNSLRPLDIMKIKEKQEAQHRPVQTQLFSQQPHSTTQPVSQPSQPDVSTNTVNHLSNNPYANMTNYQFPKMNLLVAPNNQQDPALERWTMNKATALNKTLKAFKVDGTVVNWNNGPTVTQFQIKLHLGVKVSKIKGLSDDIAMALAAKDIRIQAPIPGKTTCGIEIPNPKPRPVMLSEVVQSKAFQEAKSPLTIALGVDLSGHPRVTDLRKMPHGLIAGATGSGKSVFINCMLMSLLYKATPQQLRLILIDPKAVELAPYNGLPHLLTPVISEPKQAAASLKWCVKEMNHRYVQLEKAHVRNIEQFNTKMDKLNQPQHKMPYIVIVIDELADLMMVAGDAVQAYIVRITQKARAAGLHLIVATQRPSVDIVTGTIKNNIPARIAFMVSSQVDSRTIIDTSGAEKLLGRGDMLYRGGGSTHPIRLQGCFVSGHEIDNVVKSIHQQATHHYAFLPKHLLKKVHAQKNADSLLPQVLLYLTKQKHISISKLQRVFSIGYNRSARIIDDLQQHGYISAQDGSKPRDVYLTEAQYQKMNF